MHIKLDRPITQEEVTLLHWLLEHGDPQFRHLSLQIDALRVVSKCSCGCPTVDFDLLDGINSRKGEKLIGDELGTVDGQEVGVMLFQVDGKLSTLEVYSFAGSDKPFGLPKIEDLYRWEDLSKVRANRLTEDTLLKSASGKEVHRAKDAKDLFKKLGI
jgi:hypothetical protein